MEQVTRFKIDAVCCYYDKTINKILSGQVVVIEGRWARGSAEGDVRRRITYQLWIPEYSQGSPSLDETKVFSSREELKASLAQEFQVHLASL